MKTIAAINGVAKIIPTMPNNAPNTKIENKTARGCNPSLFPTNFGVKKLDSNSWAAKNIKNI